MKHTAGLGISGFLAALGTMGQRQRIVDCVELGRQESELLHDAGGAWAIPTKDKTSTYCGEDNYAVYGGFREIHDDSAQKAYWRDFAGWTSVSLKLDKDYNRLMVDLVLKIEIYDNSYGCGSGSHPAKIYIDSGLGCWHLLGHIKPGGQERWKVFSFRINCQLLRAQRIIVKIDDMENYKGSKAGRRLRSIGIYGI